MRDKSMQIVAIFFAVCVCFTLGILGVATAQPAVEILPSTQEVNVGGTFDVSVFLDTDGHNLVSGRVQYLTFDPTVIETSTGNVVPGDLLVTPTVAKNEVNNTAGTIRFDAGDIDWRTQTPPGNFMAVTFTVKNTAAPGTYPLNLTWMRFMDENATLWVTPTITITNASFTVEPPPPDTTAPEITNLQPAAGSCVNDATPTISASYSDAGSGINVSSVVLWLDGGMVTPDSVNETGVTYTPPADLEDGTYTVTLNVSDNAATPNTNSTSWSFTVDTGAPTVAFITPPTPVNNTEVTFNSVNVTVTVTEEGCGIDTVHLIWNGTVWVEQPPGGFMLFMTENATYSFDVTGLENGDYTYYVEATDIAGNTGYSETRVVTVNMTGMCGDVNCDETINIGDVTLLLNHWGAPSTYPLCLDWAGDVNCDGTINIGDVTLLLNHWGAPGTYPLNCC